MTPEAAKGLGELSSCPACKTDAIRVRVEVARERQVRRFHSTRLLANADALA